QALILDLRLATGERSQDALLVADALLSSGVIWRERDARGRVTEHRADPDCLFRDWPLTLLVSSHSGGNGPNLLAAALQDTARALIVGAPTLGTRYIFEDVPLPQTQGAVRVPVRIVERSLLHEPRPDDGRKAAAIVPDYPVAMTKEQTQQRADWRRLLELGKPTDGKVPEDPQLAKAVEVLKAKLNERKQNSE